MQDGDDDPVYQPRAPRPNPKLVNNGPLKARVCFGCKKPLGTLAYDGAYWHTPCFRRASPEARAKAKAETVAQQRAEIDENDRKRKLKPNARDMPHVRAAFLRAFAIVEQEFPDFGTVELHEDERGATDNGHGSERQFGYCVDAEPVVIAFAAKTEGLPVKYVDGLMRHEFGHALEFRFGVPALERLYGKLPESIERRADKIAEHVFGDRIEYGALDVQCIACEGKKTRPRRLG